MKRDIAKLREIEKEYGIRYAHMLASKPYSTLSPANYESYREQGRKIAALAREILSLRKKIEFQARMCATVASMKSRFAH